MGKVFKPLLLILAYFISSAFHIEEAQKSFLQLIKYITGAVVGSLFGRIRIGNSTASTKVSHLKSIITSTIFHSFGTHRALATLTRSKLKKINKNQPFVARFITSKSIGTNLPRASQKPSPNFTNSRFDQTAHQG